MGESIDPRARPKKDQPIFPDGHRFSIDMNAMANAEMEGNPSQVQPSPGSDYVAKIVPRKFQSLSNVDVSKISGKTIKNIPVSSPWIFGTAFTGHATN